MGVVRYGAHGTGSGGQRLPFARATSAGGFLYVSGQTAMVDGEIIDGGIVVQAHQVIDNIAMIMEEAAYGFEDVVKVNIWLDDARDFWSFNKVFAQRFGEHPPARSTVVSSLVVDCKIEIDLIAYKQA